MRVAIVSINYAPELTGIAVYTTGLAEHLAASGHAVTVHTAFPYYPEWAKRKEDHGRLWAREQRAAVDVRRSYLYVPHHPTALRRMLHEASFVAGAALSYLVAPRTGVTVVVVPPLLAGLPVALLARLRGSAVVVHVQDLQPDAAIELGMLRPGAFTRVLQAIERATYSLADRVATISGGMQRRIRDKGVPAEKLLLMRNWAQGAAIGPGDRDTRYRAEWGLGEDFVVLYAGNLGRKQGLQQVLDAARELRGATDVRWVIVGEGSERRALEAYASSEGLVNVQFRPLQPFERLGELLATADVALVPQRPGFADVVLPSKLGNILASGRPVIVTSDPDTELAQLVAGEACGLVVVAGDGAALARAVATLRAAPEARHAMAAAGVRVARELLAQQPILAAFEASLQELATSATSAGAPGGWRRLWPLRATTRKRVPDNAGT